MLNKAATAAVEGKMSKSLKKMLKKIASKDIHEELAVADAKLGGIIKVSFHFLPKIQIMHQGNRTGKERISFDLKLPI